MKKKKALIWGAYIGLLAVFAVLLIVIPSERTRVFYTALAGTIGMFGISGIAGAMDMRRREKQGMTLVWPDVFTLLAVQMIVFAFLDIGSVFCTFGIALVGEAFVYVPTLVTVAGDEQLRDAVRWLYRHRKAVVLAVLGVMIAIPAVYFGAPLVKYKWAGHLRETGAYEEAAQVFGALGDYGDAKAQRQESLYRLGMQLSEAGEYEQAYFVLGDVLDYDGVQDFIAGDENLLAMREKYAAYDVDSVVTMGEYDGKPIEWHVLDQQGSRRLLFAEKAVTQRAYNDEFAIVSWETCTLRAWLNGDFFDEAFSQEEQAMISEVTLKNADSALYRTEGGNDTVDRVFLLSADEAEAYRQGRKQLFSDSARSCWLRSPGCSRIDAAVITMGGGVDEMGSNVDGARIGVRPAIWIDLSEIE